MFCRLALTSLLVVPLVAGPLVAAPALGTVQGSETRSVVREYGDGPVRINGSDVVTIAFHGHAGDRVRLGGARPCPVSLRDSGGAVVHRASGFWRLPDAGLFVFTYRRCERQDGNRLQLDKLVVRRGRIDGAATPLELPRGYVGAVRFRVPTSGLLHLATSEDVVGAPFDSLVREDGSVVDLSGFTVASYVFTPGQRLRADELGGLPVAGKDGIVRPGERLLLVAGAPLSVWLSRPQVVPVTLDAPATAVTVGTPAYRPVLLEFHAEAGMRVYPEILGESLYTGHYLLGPDTYRYVTGNALSPLSDTGTYWWVVSTSDAPRTLDVRVRTVRTLPTPMPTDGTPVEFAAGAGDWVIAAMTLPDNASYQLAAPVTTSSAEWDAVAFGTGRLHCHGANGCGDFTTGLVTAEHPTSGMFGLLGGLDNPYYVVLRMPPGEAGTVTLRVAATGPPV